MRPGSAVLADRRDAFEIPRAERLRAREQMEEDRNPFWCYNTRHEEWPAIIEQRRFGFRDSYAIWFPGQASVAKRLHSLGRESGWTGKFEFQI